MSGRVEERLKRILDEVLGSLNLLFSFSFLKKGFILALQCLLVFFLEIYYKSGESASKNVVNPNWFF